MPNERVFSQQRLRARDRLNICPMVCFWSQNLQSGSPGIIPPSLCEYGYQGLLLTADTGHHGHARATEGDFLRAIHQRPDSRLCAFSGRNRCCHKAVIRAFLRSLVGRHTLVIAAAGRLAVLSAHRRPRREARTGSHRGIGTGFDAVGRLLLGGDMYASRRCGDQPPRSDVEEQFFGGAPNEVQIAPTSGRIQGMLPRPVLAQP